MSLGELPLLTDPADRVGAPSLVIATLPLPEAPVKPNISSSDDALYSPPQFDYLTTRGGTLRINQSCFVTWRLVDKETSLILDSVDFSGNTGKSASVKLQCPARILSDCIAFSVTKDTVVVDFISFSGFLYTACIPFSVFSGEETLSGREWRVVKKPYAFDLIRPRLLCASEASKLIVALADGQILLLTRDPLRPLGDLTSVILQDPQQPHGFSWAFRSISEKVPGYPHLNLRSAVSLTVHGDLIASYHVNNQVRLWSIEQSKCIQTIGLGSSPTRVQPSKYIEWSPDGSLLAVVGQQSLTVLAIQDEGLIRQREIELPPEVHGKFVIGLEWSGSKVVCAWKQNLSAWLMAFGDANVEKLLHRDSSKLMALPNENEDPKKLVYASYSTSTRKMALDICKPAKDADEDWLRIDRVCREIEVQGSEMLAFLPLNTDADQLLMVCGSHLSLVGQVDLAPVPLNGPSYIWDAVDDDIRDDILGLLNSWNPQGSILDDINTIGLEVSVPEEAGAESIIDRWIEQFESRLNNFGKCDGACAETLARLALRRAEQLRPQLQKLALYIIASFSEGLLNDAVGLYSRICRLYQSTNFVSIFMEHVEILEIGVSGIEWTGLGEAAENAWSFVHWHQFNLFRCLLDSQLVQPDVLYAVANKIIPGIPATFAKGLALLPSSEGETLVRQTAIPLASGKYGKLLPFVGSGLGEYYLGLSRLTTGPTALSLSISAHSSSPDAEEIALHLMKCARDDNSLEWAYEAVCVLDRLNSPEINFALSTVLILACNQGLAAAEAVLRDLPFIGMARRVHRLLSSNDVCGTLPSYKLLYRWHVAREDYVGAAAALYVQICRLQAQATTASVSKPSPKVEALFDLYTITLNVIKLAPQNERWIVASGRLVTASDIQSEYHKLLSSMNQQLQHV